jgi:hypothetical protein
MLKRAKFRPSSLARLALCSFFNSEERDDKTALIRGSAMDAGYRWLVPRMQKGLDCSWCHLIFKEENPQYDIDLSDWVSCLWASRETIDIAKLAGGFLVITDKESCQVTIPGFQSPGEVDALCSPGLFSTDVKSGGIYDYLLQQAAYAYGMMLRYFADEWVVWMLYFDSQRRIPYRFTFEQAERIILEQIERMEKAEAPEINDYCTWCSNFETCPAQRAVMDRATKLCGDPVWDFEEVKKDPVRLGEFMTICQPIAKQDGWFDRAKREAKNFLYQKPQVVVPGWGFATRQGDCVVDSRDLPSSVLKEYHDGQKIPAQITEEEYRQTCSRASVSVNEALIKQLPGNRYLIPKKTKKQ